MKKIFPLATTILMILSLNVFADATTTTTTITGTPVNVDVSGNTYTINGTTTYTTKSDYYYVMTPDGNKQVCYREAQSTYAGVNPVDVSLKIGNDLLSVHCYAYAGGAATSTMGTTGPATGAVGQ